MLVHVCLWNKIIGRIGGGGAKGHGHALPPPPTPAKKVWVPILSSWGEIKGGKWSQHLEILASSFKFVLFTLLTQGSLGQRVNKKDDNDNSDDDYH